MPYIILALIIGVGVFLVWMYWDEIVAFFQELVAAPITETGEKITEGTKGALETIGGGTKYYYEKTNLPEADLNPEGGSDLDKLDPRNW